MGTDKGGKLNWSDLRMHFVETFSILRLRVTFCVWAAVLGVAVLAGPFGSYDTMSVPIRSAYWAAVISGGFVIGFSARAVMRAVFGTRHPILFDLGASLFVGVLLGPMIWVLRGWMDPVLGHEMLSLGRITLHTALITGGVFVVRRQIGAEGPVGYWTAPEPEAEERTRLHRRLSCPPSTEIYCLSAKNHSVEVATSAGVEILRLRLTDAIAEMEPVKGLCTHRSHWVAFAAIAGIERESGGKMFVVLKNGGRIPVSRKYRSNLENSGLSDHFETSAQDC